MSFRVPDFVPEEDNPVFPRKTHESAGDDFVELIWQKGPIFRRRSPDPPHGDSALRFVSNSRAASGVSAHTATAAAAASLPSTTELFMEEDEMASWLYYPLGGDDDPGGVGTVAGVNPTEQPREAAAAALPEQGFFPPAAAGRAVEADGWAATGRPPRHPQAQEMSTGCLGAPRPPPTSGESTVVNTGATTTEPGRSRPWAESRVSSGDARVGAAACELGPASSSGLSCDGEEAGASAAAMAVGRGDERKRRAREDDDDCDSHSEDGEFESSGGKRRDSRRSASARRARAAQVHNMSERRRRDRINEKMKALQQLIPRCHKSDKASMLDDAIEYMKSLKMQVQMMSMCCNMTPMMFPGVQQYMPSLGMGMPMGMNMGMGMGMAMRMNMASGGLSHPMMPCPTLMPAAQMAANGAPHLTQRLPVQAAHAPVAALAEQMRLQATNQVDPTSSTACIRTPGTVQMPNLPAVLHQARSQNPASATEAGISKRTSCMPADKSKLG